MTASLIEELEKLRDDDNRYPGVFQIGIELIKAGLSGADLRAAMRRIEHYFQSGDDPADDNQAYHPRLPDNEWWPLRWRVLKRDNFTCQYCGHYDPPRNKVEPGRKESLCADHITPLSRGGTNEEANLVCACIACNSSKSDRLLSEWRGRYQ